MDPVHYINLFWVQLCQIWPTLGQNLKDLSQNCCKLQREKFNQIGPKSDPTQTFCRACIKEDGTLNYGQSDKTFLW
jgi:hypothetical protein